MQFLPPDYSQTTAYGLALIPALLSLWLSFLFSSTILNISPRNSSFSLYSFSHAYISIPLQSVVQVGNLGAGLNGLIIIIIYFILSTPSTPSFTILCFTSTYTFLVQYRDNQKPVYQPRLKKNNTLSMCSFRSTEQQRDILAGWSWILGR